MGKNKSGKYIPPKGRPSGSGRESSGLKEAFAVTSNEEDKELTDKYLEDPDEPLSNVHVRHHNRNIDRDIEPPKVETE